MNRRTLAPAVLASALLCTMTGVLLSGCGGSGPVSVRPDTMSVALLDAYRVDATRLAVRSASAALPDSLRTPEISADSVASYLAALTAVWSLSGEARDSVVTLHEIHTFPEPDLTDLVVGPVSGSTVAVAWAAGRRLTGEPGIDALLNAYGLVLVSYDDGLGTPWAVLRAPVPLDVAALGARFGGLPGIRYAQPNEPIGDGDDIRARASGGELLLDYSVGFGDCPAGCIHRTTWTFAVAGGVARFVGRSVR